MAEGNGALGHEGRSNRDVELLCEGDQVLGGLGTDHAVAGHDQRVRRDGYNLGSLFDLRSGRHRGHRPLHFQRRLAVEVHLGDVFRKIDKACAGFLCLRLLEGLAYDLRNVFRFTNLGAVFGNGAEEVDKI